MFLAPQVEPFYAKTISKDSTHSSLKIFFKNLYKSMDKDVTDFFFNFNKPEFDGVSEEMLIGVKERCSTTRCDALQWGIAMSKECLKKCLKDPQV